MIYDIRFDIIYLLIFSLHLEFWIHDNVSERTHSLPHDDWRLDKVRISQDKDMSWVTDT